MMFLRLSLLREKGLCESRVLRVVIVSFMSLTSLALEISLFCLRFLSDEYGFSCTVLKLNLGFTTHYYALP